MQNYLQGTQHGASALSKTVYWFEFDKILMSTNLWHQGTLGFSKLNKKVLHNYIIKWI